MDVTRIERTLLAAGFVAIAVLGYLAYQSWIDYRQRDPAVAPTPARAVTEAAPQVTTEPVSTFAPTTAVAKGPPLLIVSATRADSWMSVRRESPNGRVLFEGVLTHGKSLTFKESRVWIRFGSAENVAAKLGGRRLRLGAGIVEVFVGENGVER